MNTATDFLMTLRKLPQPGQRYGYCASAFANPSETSGIALAQMPLGQQTFGVVLMDDGRIETVDLVVAAGVGWKLVEDAGDESALHAETLPAAGTRIGYVNVGVDHPAEQAGTVIAHVPHYSGTRLLALVLMDDGTTAYANEVIALDPDFPFFGLGWYEI